CSSSLGRIAGSPHERWTESQTDSYMTDGLLGGVITKKNERVSPLMTGSEASAPPSKATLTCVYSSPLDGPHSPVVLDFSKPTNAPRSARTATTVRPVGYSATRSVASAMVLTL